MDESKTIPDNKAVEPSGEAKKKDISFAIKALILVPLAAWIVGKLIVYVLDRLHLI